MYSFYLQIDAFIFFTEPLRAILNSFQLAFKMHLRQEHQRVYVHKASPIVYSLIPRFVDSFTYCVQVFLTSRVQSQVFVTQDRSKMWGWIHLQLFLVTNCELQGLVFHPEEPIDADLQECWLWHGPLGSFLGYWCTMQSFFEGLLKLQINLNFGLEEDTTWQALNKNDVSTGDWHHKSVTAVMEPLWNTWEGACKHHAKFTLQSEKSVSRTMFRHILRCPGELVCTLHDFPICNQCWRSKWQQDLFWIPVDWGQEKKESKESPALTLTSKERARFLVMATKSVFDLGKDVCPQNSLPLRGSTPLGTRWRC